MGSEVACRRLSGIYLLVALELCTHRTEAVLTAPLLPRKMGGGLISGDDFAPRPSEADLLTGSIERKVRYG